jgi:uncharacterized protein DUF6894
MPRYFFHLTEGHSLSVADEAGEEFDGMEAARLHAKTVAGKLARGRLPCALVGCHISVIDERGVVVFKVPLSLRRWWLEPGKPGRARLRKARE